MAIYSFGAGTLIATRQDVAGSTPTNFGTLQNVSVEFSGESKKLFGQKQYPVAVARGQQTITCSAEAANFSANLFNSTFFGGTLASGSTALAVTEAGSIPATTTYTVTVTNSATWVADEGVTYAATGLPFTKVATTPTVGEYSVAAGVYTFAAADASLAVFISYTYTISASGQTLTMTNPLQGINPVFSVVLRQQVTLGGGLKWAMLKLNSCVSSKLTASTKQADFGIPKFDFDAFADASDNVFTWSFSEVS
jgi:hypothetical protein